MPHGLEQQHAKADIRAQGAAALAWIEQNHGRGIVLAGRPYHVDPEINHGIPELIASYDLAVLTEDSSAHRLHACPAAARKRPVGLSLPPLYGGRVRPNPPGAGACPAQLLRLRARRRHDRPGRRNSGERSNRLYTVLKIDEVSNLGAARIRIRSLIAAMDLRARQGILPTAGPVRYERAVFTEQMRREHWTILAPQMSPIHFDLLGPTFRKYGYHIEILGNDNRSAIDTGLKYVNNDACYPLHHGRRPDHGAPFCPENTTQIISPSP